MDAHLHLLVMWLGEDRKQKLKGLNISLGSRWISFSSSYWITLQYKYLAFARLKHTEMLHCAVLIHSKFCSVTSVCWILKCVSWFQSSHVLVWSFRAESEDREEKRIIGLNKHSTIMSPTGGALPPPLCGSVCTLSLLSFLSFSLFLSLTSSFSVHPPPSEFFFALTHEFKSDRYQQWTRLWITQVLFFSRGPWSYVAESLQQPNKE